jgi:hypothetical protein
VVLQQATNKDEIQIKRTFKVNFMQYKGEKHTILPVLRIKYTDLFLNDPIRQLT